jgi:hypothetical protein
MTPALVTITLALIAVAPFAGLPGLAGVSPGAAPWWTILGIPQTATVEQINAAWKAKAREMGATGNEAARAELNVARDKGIAERTSTKGDQP